MSQYRINGIAGKIILSDLGECRAIMEAAHLAVGDRPREPLSYFIGQRDLVTQLILKFVLYGEDATLPVAGGVAELLFDHAEENPQRVEGTIHA